MSRVDPASNFVAVAPSDTVDLAQAPRALFVGTGGSLILRNAAGVSVTFKNVQSGALLPVQPRRVLATGTTAADIVAFY